MTFIERLIFINIFSTIIINNNPRFLHNLLLIGLHLEAVFATFLHDQFTGLSLAMQRISGNSDIVTLHAQNPEWSNGVFGRAWADERANPADGHENLFRIEAVLDGAGAARAKTSDANHFLYLAKANQLFVTGNGEFLYEGLLEIDVPVLIVHTDEDLVFPGNAVRETAAIIKSDGTYVEIVELEGTRGHLDGVLSMQQAGAAVKSFMERDF